MVSRILILTFCFLSASVLIALASKAEPSFTREPLAHVPMQIGPWQGRDIDLDDRVARVLGVDDYLNRSYSTAMANVGLYVGFYQTQRQGSSIHSPLNCLPGAGWNPLDRLHLTIAVAGPNPDT